MALSEPCGVFAVFQEADEGDVESEEDNRVLSREIKQLDLGQPHRQHSQGKAEAYRSRQAKRDRVVVIAMHGNLAVFKGGPNANSADDDGNHGETNLLRLKTSPAAIASRNEGDDLIPVLHKCPTQEVEHDAHRHGCPMPNGVLAEEHAQVDHQREADDHRCLQLELSLSVKLSHAIERDANQKQRRQEPQSARAHVPELLVRQRHADQQLVNRGFAGAQYAIIEIPERYVHQKQHHVGNQELLRLVDNASLKALVFAGTERCARNHKEQGHMEGVNEQAMIRADCRDMTQHDEKHSRTAQLIKPFNSF